jgi:hypothetical protein
VLVDSDLIFCLVTPAFFFFDKTVYSSSSAMQEVIGGRKKVWMLINTSFLFRASGRFRILLLCIPGSYSHLLLILNILRFNDLDTSINHCSNKEYMNTYRPLFQEGFQIFVPQILGRLAQKDIQLCLLDIPFFNELFDLILVPDMNVKKMYH